MRPLAPLNRRLFTYPSTQVRPPSVVFSTCPFCRTAHPTDGFTKSNWFACFSVGCARIKRHCIPPSEVRSNPFGVAAQPSSMLMKEDGIASSAEGLALNFTSLPNRHLEVIVGLTATLHVSFPSAHLCDKGTTTPAGKIKGAWALAIPGWRHVFGGNFDALHVPPPSSV
jgi:hypothetical protein